MNGPGNDRFIRSVGIVAVLLLSVISLKADPISPGEGSWTFMAFIPIALAILLEAICIWLMLRRRRTPRFFILWLLAMHLATYPLFLGFLWWLYGTRPAFAMVLGEAAIVLVEGSLIYLMCRYISSRQSSLPLPSMAKSLFVSLVGNICSAVAFPLLLQLFGLILGVMPFDLD